MSLFYIMTTDGSLIQDNKFKIQSNRGQVVDNVCHLTIAYSATELTKENKFNVQYCTIFGIFKLLSAAV